MQIYTCKHPIAGMQEENNLEVYFGVRTCELFLCFTPFVFLGSIVLTSLFYVTGELTWFIQNLGGKIKDFLRNKIIFSRTSFPCNLP